jgi:hypothetical protein
MITVHPPKIWSNIGYINNSVAGNLIQSDSSTSLLVKKQWQMISGDNQRCCICSSETIVAKQARSVNERPGESIRRRLMGMKAGLKLGLQK